MKTFLKHFKWVFTIGVLCLLIGVGIGVLIPITSPIAQGQNEYETGGGYKFINPLLECGEGQFSSIQNSQTNQLKDQVNSYISQEQQDGNITDASVYFRELNGGQFFEIDPDEQFVPASLLKVPLAMSVLQQAENDPALLSQKVFFAASSTAPATEYFTAPTIAQNKSYTVQQLLSAMLIDSDNNAALLLTNVISTADLDEAYSNLGVIVPENLQYTITTPIYASFFRVLYNATYLDHDDSEEMLKLLSQSTFTQGIVAGVPQGTVVAHKFGERGYNNDAEPNQLHDCGIVYASQPYLICVMTEGQDYDTMANVIANISKLIYNGTASSSTQ